MIYFTPSAIPSSSGVAGKTYYCAWHAEKAVYDKTEQSELKRQVHCDYLDTLPCSCGLPKVELIDTSKQIVYNWGFR